MNDENLIPLNQRTKSEQRAITSAGGKASGEARRRRKTNAEAIEILSRPFDMKNVSQHRKGGYYGVFCLWKES